MLQSKKFPNYFNLFDIDQYVNKVYINIHYWLGISCRK